MTRVGTYKKTFLSSIEFCWRRIFPKAICHLRNSALRT